MIQWLIVLQHASKEFRPRADNDKAEWYVSYCSVLLIEFAIGFA